MENSKTKFRPILFSTPMVQAILEGRKTQTRRIVKLPNFHPSVLEKQISKMTIKEGIVYDGNNEVIGTIKWPYQVGDVLWVRETFHENIAPALVGTFYYKASIDPSWDLKWKPSLFMPKAACRIFLKLKAIRIERLDQISEADAMAEGVLEDNLFGHVCYECGKNGHLGAKDLCKDGFFFKAVDSFKSLWKSINGNDSWNNNPYVFVYEFERIEKPLDFIA